MKWASEIDRGVSFFFTAFERYSLRGLEPDFVSEDKNRAPMMERLGMNHNPFQFALRPWLKRNIFEAKSHTAQLPAFRVLFSIREFIRKHTNQKTPTPLSRIINLI
jgi:hypothetical protein